MIFVKISHGSGLAIKYLQCLPASGSFKTVYVQIESVHTPFFVASSLLKRWLFFFSGENRFIFYAIYAIFLKYLRVINEL